MDIALGVVLALAIGLFGTLTGMDRERAFYPTVMCVIALYYALFAAISGSMQVLAHESPAILFFLALSVAGFRHSLWWTVAALALHGVFDLNHARWIHDPGVPAFWPGFCLSYDIVAAGYLAWLVRSGRVRVRPGTEGNGLARGDAGPRA